MLLCMFPALMLYAAVHSGVTEGNVGGLEQELALPVTRLPS